MRINLLFIFIESPSLFTNDKILIGDKAYDSKPLEEKVKNIQLGKLLRDRNKINNKTNINKQLEK